MDVLILKSLALASKPQVLENCPVLGSSTALFLNRWNFVGKRQKPCGKSAKTFFLVSSSRYRLKKIFWRPFFLRWHEKNFWRPFFFRRTLASLSLVLGLGFKRVCPWPWPRPLYPRLHLCYAEQQSFIIWIVAILLASTKKSLKGFRFESAQVLVSLNSLNFFSFVFGLFCCRSWHWF